MKKYVLSYSACCNTVWLIDGNARFTGPNGRTFDEAPAPRLIPSDANGPMAGPAEKPSENIGKSISRVSKSRLAARAELNSVIVRSADEKGCIYTKPQLEMNGMPISVKAAAGCTATIITQTIATAYAKYALTFQYSPQTKK